MERGEKKEKVLAFLRRGIQSGKWKDEILPKEEELAEKLHMARGTVRKAFAQLVAEGLLERRKRGGTRLINYNDKKGLHRLTYLDSPQTRSSGSLRRTPPKSCADPQIRT